jgi:hypothetical protein
MCGVGAGIECRVPRLLCSAQSWLLLGARWSGAACRPHPARRGAADRGKLAAVIAEMARRRSRSAGQPANLNSDQWILEEAPQTIAYSRSAISIPC